VSTPVSMTGFGRAQGRLSERFDAGLVVRAVNHRFLDVSVRINLRDELPEAEVAVREEIERVASRGRVSVQVNLERLTPADTRISVDRSAVLQVMEQVVSLMPVHGSIGPARLGDILQLPGVVTHAGGQTVLNQGELEELRRLAADAATDFLAMRRAEGQRLVERVEDDLGVVEEFVDWVEPRASELRSLLLERLGARMTELLGDAVDMDETRLLQEAALMADRADVTEELVRLRTHFGAFRSRLVEGGAVGRALDFLCQEIHRELNTLGSKLREAGMGERLVDAKTATERVREQIQNLE
jgi:uncharacterized protein (TIGR00255 family)